MQIKIHCRCGSKFAFDVEPIKGRMPVTVACPTCGLDATNQANRQIEEILAPKPGAQTGNEAPSAPKAAGRLHVTLPTPATETSATEATPLAVQRPHSPRPAETHSSAAVCGKHVGQPTTESCRVCGKPICCQCMAMFGYVCSVFCRNKAEAEGIELPVYARQRTVVQGKARKRGRIMMAAAVSVVLLIIAAGVYYKAYASKPHVIHTQAISISEFDSGSCELLDENTYLSIVGGKMSLHALNSEKALWTASLDTGPEEEALATGLRGTASLIDARDNLWVLSGNRVQCYERGTGARNHQVKIDGYINEYLADDDYIMLISMTGGDFSSTQRTMTRIALADGGVTTHEIVPPEKGSASGSKRNDPTEDEAKSSFIATGPNVVELQVKLLEARTITREVIKKPKNSIVDSGQVSGANSMQAAEELLNEIVRGQTGGVEHEDASRYEVTLRRYMEDNAQEWTGEVVGQVLFHPLKTVDLLVAGKSLHVFDKLNNLKWNAPLTFPVDESFQDSFGGRTAPALESKEMLYFFDQGMLTAFDSATGNVRWRIPSVGIHQVQKDPHGHLYVCSTTGGADDIQYSQQIKVIDMVEPVLMKVDAENGEVLWRTSLVGDNCFLTGDYVYTTKSTIDLTIALNPDDDSTHFRVIRVNPKNGRRIWTYYQPQEATALDFRDNVILLQFPDQMQILKYMSL